MGEFAGQCKKPLIINGKSYYYYELDALRDQRIESLPFSIRILLESAVRNCDGLSVTCRDVETILDWQVTQTQAKEIAFKPARVILQDFTGVPAVVDLAAMRDAVAELGGDPNVVNPIIPCDLVIDHSVQVDFARTPDALRKNEEMEFYRNRERYEFLKWGMHAFRNFLIVPPASGIVHQVNLEYLARVVFKSDDNTLYPDSVLGTDSHTTMINGLSVLGWGVGGIEAEAALLGQSVSMVLPEVVGFKLTGALDKLITSTDLVLTITKQLRALGVVGRFVEFFGPGLAHLSIADRATISNMSPEMGSTCCFFAPDHKTIEYLRQTGRSEEHISYIEGYFKAQKLFRDYSVDTGNANIVYTETVGLDLSTVVPCLSGPKRPQDRVALTDMQNDYRECLTHKIGFKGYGIAEAELKKSVPFEFDDNNDGEACALTHGDVVIAAITSCTNTSNPSVMIGAGMVAQNAVKKGLKVKRYIKTSLAPGSAVVTRYLEASGVMPALHELGFDLVGYGCTTCIGNSGPLHANIEQAIEGGDLVVASVLSGNRNFEGRVHPYTRANYLCSPMLVVAYALAGTVDFDFDTMPLGESNGKPVFLRDIWPSRNEIERVVKKNVLPEMFKSNYSTIQNGSEQWNAIHVSHSTRYPWNVQSTYIKNPPYFEGLCRELLPIAPIRNAMVLLNLGDSITTDHISPAGAISKISPAAQYLQECGVTDAKEYNSYGARRGNDAVMVRGTFANTRLVNKFMAKAGPRTVHFPTGDEMNIFDAAERYKRDGVPLLILAGKEYGSGSSRDWAAKGPLLMGVRAVLAESFERIHRSNLVGMGIVPLQYLPGDTAESLQLTGRELYSVELPSDLKTAEEVLVALDDGRKFSAVARFDTEVELQYFRHGGIMQYMIRKLAGACE